MEYLEPFNIVGEWVLANLSIEGLISLPALMVGFLVAIAIYTFEDSRKGLQIDAPTVMSRVVRVDSVLAAIFLVSLLPIFWGINSSSIEWLLPLLAIIYLVGLLMLTQSLQRAFKWAKSIETGTQDNFRTVKRSEYLELLKDEEKRAAWEKIWQADESVRKLLDERHLVKLFIASVKNIKDKKSYSPWLVQDFISVLDTIRLDDPIIMYDLVDFCLEGMLDKRKTNEKQETGELHYYMNLRRLFFKILDLALEKDDNSLYTLITRSREYIKTNNLDEADFIKSFAPNFLTNIEKKDDQNWAWETFPDEWKITVTRLLDQDIKEITFAWLNAYSGWLSSKNLYNFNEHKEFDFKIDSITNALFPTMDTIQFSRLFAFQWAGFGVEDGESSEHAQVRNAVENQLTIGHIGHSYTTLGASDEELYSEFQKEHEELVDFAAKTTLFPSLHSKAEVGKYLKAIQDLMSENESNEDILKRLQWLDMILRNVRKKINKIASQQREKSGDKQE